MLADTLLHQRHVPSVLDTPSGRIDSVAAFEKHKDTIRHTLETYAYGRMPKTPDAVRFHVTGEEQNACAGHATVRYLQADVDMDGKTFSFPFFEAIPKGPTQPCPAFVYIRFYQPIQDKYLPLEEIIDRGYAVFSFCYQDATTDDGDFQNGVAPYLCPDRQAPDAPGKIAMWAWCAMRVMDYVATQNGIDQQRVAVIGHSRLGKTALVAGAYDERFRYVISNDSGCMGAAITRDKVGESHEAIGRVFPHWFCPRFPTFSDRVDTLPYDQNFLLSLSVPRSILVGSAEEDLWADPASEFLSLYMTNEVYALYGMRGLISDGHVPSAPFISDHAGDASYHVRTGTHFISRNDFNVYMDFMDTKRTDRT